MLIKDDSKYFYKFVLIYGSYNKMINVKIFYNVFYFDLNYKLGYFIIFIIKIYCYFYILGNK